MLLVFLIFFLKRTVHLVHLYGIPKSINRDTKFMNNFEGVFRGVQLNFSNAYHPYGNDQIEIVNRSLRILLSYF